VEKQKLKNMLLIMGFNGRNYKGSMYSPEPGQRTVEGELEKALVEAQII
jgi:tRNA U38,U39,U40 pseudouridine synthase TruA